MNWSQHKYLRLFSLEARPMRSSARMARKLSYEGLEPRFALAGSPFEPTSQDQLMLELINRTRLDPIGEVARNTSVNDLNQGLPAGSISSTPKQPLAFNLKLMEAARGHTEWMLTPGVQVLDHCGPNRARNNNGGCVEGPFERMAKVGYAAGWSGENLSVVSNSNDPTRTSEVQRSHDILFTSPGHRSNLLNQQYKEFGVGLATGFHSNFQAFVNTEKFANRFPLRPFLTGVVYRDSVIDNDFYSIGEGLGGISVVATRMGDGASFSTTTFASGGYQIELTPGEYDVSFAGNGLGSPRNFRVTLTSDNQKLDVESSTVKRLSVIASNSILRENGGGTELIVQRETADMTSALSVKVSASIANVLSVPTNVVIPANQSSFTFTIQPMNNSIVDRTRTVDLAFESSGFESTTIALSTIDDDGPSIWTNPFNPFDVNNDGTVSPFDILLIINQLKRSTSSILQNDLPANIQYVDCNGDWLISPIDILQVINHLNRRGNSESEPDYVAFVATVAPLSIGPDDAKVSLLVYGYFDDVEATRRRSSGRCVNSESH